MYMIYIVYILVFVHVGNFLNQQSPLFQEEFPQLASGGEEKSPVPRQGDEYREAQHGAVPDLKHPGICCFVSSVVYRHSAVLSS